MRYAAWCSTIDRVPKLVIQPPGANYRIRALDEPPMTRMMIVASTTTTIAAQRHRRLGRPPTAPAQRASDDLLRVRIPPHSRCVNGDCFRTQRDQHDYATSTNANSHIPVSIKSPPFEPAAPVIANCANSTSTHLIHLTSLYSLMLRLSILEYIGDAQTMGQGAALWL